MDYIPVDSKVLSVCFLRPHNFLLDMAHFTTMQEVVGNLRIQFPTMVIEASMCEKVGIIFNA